MYHLFVGLITPQNMLVELLVHKKFQPVRGRKDRCRTTGTLSFDNVALLAKMAYSCNAYLKDKRET